MARRIISVSTTKKPKKRKRKRKKKGCHPTIYYGVGWEYGRHYCIAVGKDRSIETGYKRTKCNYKGLKEAKLAATKLADKLEKKGCKRANIKRARNSYIDTAMFQDKHRRVV